MARQAYDTDRTDTQWDVVALGVSGAPPSKRGRPRKQSIREMLNAILYMLTAGGVWRLLPQDLPPWKTVYRYFRKWRHELYLWCDNSSDDETIGKDMTEVQYKMQ
jgi:putative transposase